MKSIFTKLSSLLEDGSEDKTWSTTRFTFLFTVILTNIVIFTIWAIICMYKKEIIEIPSSIVTIYSMANGITAASKIVQKHIEKKSKEVFEEEVSEPTNQPTGDA